MQYRVIMVGDDDLPEGVDWALVREPGTVYAFIKESKVTGCALSEAWRGSMRLTGGVVSRLWHRIA